MAKHHTTEPGYIAERHNQDIVSAAGHLDPEWIAGCRQNEGGDETLEEWIIRATNSQIIEIDAAGAVWLGRQNGDFFDGHWLDPAAIAELMADIDRGV